MITFKDRFSEGEVSAHLCRSLTLPEEKFEYDVSVWTDCDKIYHLRPDVARRFAAEIVRCADEAERREQCK